MTIKYQLATNNGGRFLYIYHIVWISQKNKFWRSSEIWLKTFQIKVLKFPLVAIDLTSNLRFFAPNIK